MSNQFTAVLLLKAPWRLDADQIAAQLRVMFPQIGTVEVLPGQDSRPASALVSIDGGDIVIQSAAKRYDPALMEPPLKTLRVWDPAMVVAEHRAHVVVSCGPSLGGGSKGVGDAKAYAAAAHFVAAVVASCAPVTAVFWEPSYSLTRPADFIECTAVLLGGRMPIGCWLTYATIVPKGYRPEDATGMVTYGLKPFIGRELELAPQSGSAKDAYRQVSFVARAILDREAELQDGQTILGADSDLIVRERVYWLRRDQSAYVLLTDSAVVDHETLKPLARAVA